MIHQTFLMGADYNPEQWLSSPEVLKSDIEMMHHANCNVMTLGMFAWPFLEPAEGDYHIEWLKEIIDRLYDAGIYTILGTPSGARPRWLAQTYPEALRVDAQRRRMLFGERHNHCFTSPIYRAKVAAVNQKLAQTFAHHPGVILWHLSNEYSGECHCPLCQAAFRDWLKQRYQTIDALNTAWSAAFWGHLYTEWQQVESPSPLGDQTFSGLQLDWRRFCSAQTIDFANAEAAAIHSVCPAASITTNMMYYTYDVDYFKMAQTTDIVSWDSYPLWHNADTAGVAADTALYHDMMRSLKNEPFLLMESTPNVTSWQPVARQKRPGMNLLSSLQAVAHGADSVQFFQWRQSIGNSEKFHGAIVDHYGEEDVRVFKEVTELGHVLQQLEAICGTHTKSEVAILFDWQNRWAIDGACGPFNSGADYKAIVKQHYNGLRQQGINIDLIDSNRNFAPYKLLIAPMLYLFAENVSAKLRTFVENGGTLLIGPYSGVVNQNDQCFLGGTPYDLMDVLGLRTVELDGLYPEQQVLAAPARKNVLSLSQNYPCKQLCEVISCTSAQEILHYASEYYQDTPMFTVNCFGKGMAYYLASVMAEPFYRDVYHSLLPQCGIKRLLPFDVPPYIDVAMRESADVDYVFLQNFAQTACKLPLTMLLQTGWQRLYQSGGNEKDMLCGYATAVFSKEKICPQTK